MKELYEYRLGRTRHAMASSGVDFLVLTSPTNLRYAVDFNEYSNFQGHIPTACLFLPIEGPLTLLGATRRDYPFVNEYRPSGMLTPFDGGLDLNNHATSLAKDIEDKIRKMGLKPKQSVIGLERFSPLLTSALSEKSINIVDGECVLEKAKIIKSNTEINCIKHAINVAEHGMQKMQENTKSGMTERQLWSILHQVNVANNGDWIEGHMLSSGTRTNPWLQEASDRVIEKGDMVAFDTDMIGPHGYMADISRSWLCESSSPTTAQRDAYQHAYEEVHHNIDIIKPGMRFSELSKKAFKRRPNYRKNHYVCVFHGAGLSDEYPKIYYQEDWDRYGYDGVVEPNMVMCVESYSGVNGGIVGVKLEEMVLVTDKGTQLLSKYPFESCLM